MNINLCPSVTFEIKREKIFKGLEYDLKNKEIYTSCGSGPLAKVKNGKIKWLKYN